MKSSTRNQPNPNIQSLLRVEFVKRFEAMMRQEMALHSKALSDYQKEMQSLKDSVDSAKEKVESLYHHTDKKFLDETAAIHMQLAEVDTKIKCLNLTSIDQRGSILSLHQTLLDFINLSSKKTDFETFKKEVHSTIKDASGDQTRSLETYQKEIEYILNSLREEQVKLRFDMEDKLNQLEERFNNKCSFLKMDKDGLSKEIRVYEKTIFIMEKKIENLYTLIERINKRGEACHKQA